MDDDLVPVDASGPAPSFLRPRNGRVIAGVCAAIADRYGWSRTVVRLLFVASTLLPGPQVVVYLVLWLLFPNEPRRRG